MLISKTKKTNKKSNNLNKFFQYYFFVTITLLSLFLFLIFNGGYFTFYKDKFYNKIYVNSYINFFKLPKIIYYSIHGNFLKVPEINLIINFENKIILEKDRSDVMAIGKGHTYAFKEVPAKINYKNKNYKIKIRLKGDRKEHFSNIEKSSYKIEIQKEDKIFGIRKFSLMKPRMRNYIHEWIYHELMKEGDVINLKYNFIKLKINGESKGLYVVEEGFDKILIERNKRRNGPIFSLKEEWNMGFEHKKPLLFEVYNKSTWLSEQNIEMTKNTKNLLDYVLNSDGYMNEDTFDYDRWAWFLAAADINYYSHGLHAKSVKFFYNPLSSKFEPVAFDGHRIVVDYNEKIIAWKKNSDWRNSSPSFINALKCKKQKENQNLCEHIIEYKLFFKENGKLNNIFFNKYKENIKIISSKKFLDNFFKQRKKEIFKINSKIYGDYFYADNIRFYGPGIYFFNKESLYHRSKELVDRLSNIQSNIVINQEYNKITTKIWNSMSTDRNDFYTNRNLKIKEIYCKNIIDNKNIVINTNQEVKKGNQSFIFAKEKNLNCSNVIFYDEIFKKKFEKKIEILTNENEYKKSIIFSDFSKYFYLENKKLKLKNDKTIIDKNINIPEGYVVKINPEQKIILINNSIILSRSPFQADGGDPLLNKPIEIGGYNNNKGGGIYIIGSKSTNLFNNILFKNLNGAINHIFLNKFIIYGAINIYSSSIELKNFSFRNISSEDALNVVSSNFTITDGNFEDIDFDGIDIDNGSGKIDNINFKNISNDGLDFSESSITVSNVSFNNIGDKAVSAGENSKINMQNLNISKSFLGIVSKDGSHVKATQVKLKDIKIPFASYIKKNEYREPNLLLNNVVADNFETLYYKDRNSKILIDNINQKKVTKNVYDKIYK